jgi:hypothetical protein
MVLPGKRISVMAKVVFGGMGKTLACYINIIRMRDGLSFDSGRIIRLKYGTIAL